MRAPEVKAEIEPPEPPLAKVVLTLDMDTAIVLRHLIGETAGNSPHISRLYEALRDAGVLNGALSDGTVVRIGTRTTLGSPVGYGVWLEEVNA